MRDFLRVYWPFVVLAFIGLIVAFRFVEPPPPRTVTLAAGSPGGAYYAFAQRYQRAMAVSGVRVNIMETAGSVENLRHLASGEADFAIVQGGMAREGDSDGFVSLGGMFHEPLWVFVRRDAQLNTLDALKQARMSIGPEGSGTRTLAIQLRRQWGDGWGPQTELQLTGSDAEQALLSGEIDAAIFVAAIEAPYVQRLLMESDITLTPFPRGPALARRNASLAPITLLRGVVDIEDDIPSSDVPLIAPVAQLTARRGLHPAIQALLLDTASIIHSEANLLADAKTFPDSARVDLPLSPEARRYYARGPSTLRRWFSFGVANFLERAWVLIIPFLTLLFPLVRAAPPIYRWRIRRRIYVWYSDLRELENRGRTATTSQARARIVFELRRLQQDVGAVEVPLSYTDDLYRLRSHILFVENLMERLEEAAVSGQAPVSPAVA